MSRFLPPLNALKAFEAAARHLSFRLAAEELRLTPSAVSRHIKVLEDVLGVRLFERGYRKVQLTKSGEAYASSLEGLFDRMADATAVISGRPVNVASRPLIIATYPTFALRWLTPRWGRFLAQHPSLRTRLVTTTTVPDCYRDGCDAAIWFGATPPADHAAFRLAPAEVSPLCAPQLCTGDASPPLTQVGHLRNHTLLHSDLRAMDWRLWLSAAVEAGEATEAGIEDIDPDKGIRLENANLAYQSALAGGGVVIGFNLLLVDEIGASRLVRPFRTVRQSHRSFWLIWRNERRPDSRIEVFKSWIEQEIQTSILRLNELVSGNELQSRDSAISPARTESIAGCAPKGLASRKLTRATRK